MVELGFCEAEAGGPLRQALPQARGGRAGRDGLGGRVRSGMVEAHVGGGVTVL